MYEPLDLLALAGAYRAATGLSLATIGHKAARNTWLFIRIEQGCSCNVRTARAASDFFNQNWPEAAPWPLDTPRPKVSA